MMPAVDRSLDTRRNSSVVAGVAMGIFRTILRVWSAGEKSILVRYCSSHASTLVLCWLMSRELSWLLLIPLAGA
jgi:hypothetical protein